MRHRLRITPAREILAALCLSLLCAGTAADTSGETIPAGGGSGSESFRFAVVGDTQPRSRYGAYPPVSGKIIDEIAVLSPDFVAHVGDIIWGYASNRNTMARQIREFRELTGKIKAPLYVAFGNHEMSCNGSLEELEEKFGYLYTSFDHKGIHCVLLNMYMPGDGYGEIEGMQRSWLERDLKANAGTKPVFIFMHLPLFPGVLSDEMKPAHCEELHALFLRYGVRAVFSGHLHFYDHTRRDGIDYYTTGGGGGQLLLVPEKSFHHFLLVTVRGDAFDVEVRRSGSRDPSDYLRGESLRYMYCDEPLRSLTFASVAPLLYKPSRDMKAPGDRLLAEGCASHEEGDLVTALKRYEKALVANPGLAGARNNKALILHRKALRREAEEMLASLLAEDSSNDTARFNCALIQMEDDAARALRTLAWDSTPEGRSAILSLGRGAVHERMNDRRQAEIDYRQAIERDPHFIPAYTARINLLLREGARESAVQQCQRMIASNPLNASAWEMQGEMFLRMERYRDAADSYRKGAALQAPGPRSLNNFGVASQKIGGGAHAQSCFEQALRSGVYCPEATFNLTQSLLKEWTSVGADEGRRTPEAIKSAEAAVPLLKSLLSEETPAAIRARALNNLGTTYYMSGYMGSEEIVYYFTQASAADPELAVAHSNMGSIYWETNQIGLSGLSFLRAMKLDPGFLPARCNLALLLFSEKKIEEAIALFKAVLEQDPAYCDALNGLGEAYMYLHGTTPGDSLYAEMAREAWRKSYALNRGQLFIRYRIGDGRGETPGAPKNTAVAR